MLFHQSIVDNHHAIAKAKMKSIKKLAQSGYEQLGRGAVASIILGKSLSETVYVPLAILRQNTNNDSDVQLVEQYDPLTQAVVMLTEKTGSSVTIHVINFPEPKKHQGFGQK